jgi:PD-(D/E)XK nuclease superfamily protein
MHQGVLTSREGPDFSRAAKYRNSAGALAPEVSFSSQTSETNPAYLMRRNSLQSRQQAFAKRQKRAQRTGKKRGELAELAFIHKAASLGLAVAKPYGDSEPYDFIVYNGPRFHKVQVKSTSNLVHGAYPLNSRRKRKGQRVPYTAKEIDFLIAHVPPENAWFVIPIQALLSHPSIRLYPRGSNRQGHFEKYRDAWHLLE